MSTRSAIIVNTADGKWRVVYCHHDGYIDGVGRTLFKYYNSQERADALVEHGDMSSLAENCDAPPGHSYEKPVKGHTVYYGRDRGEIDADGHTVETLDLALKLARDISHYVYVFKEGAWFYGDSLVDLGEALR